ncbi:DUF6249 domain-containing protein [uncultured Brevundimonas sp.]|uniref:DUF6249 domain-containing protein n=1 Tax=uncultured Brevundimonas sp. TaxID=213418 RepID=UPI0030EB4A97|tara:strand:+ start:4587 stop:4970 length:384 start_codon:yes stop_codon:yes gene_type:complete
MEGFQILIPLAPFLMVVAIVIIPRWFKANERREMQQTLRSAIDKGQPLPPEIIEAMGRDEIRKAPSAARDLRLGIILLAVSVGIGLMGYAISFDEMDAFYPITGMAAIPGMIGLAFIVLSFFNKNKG